MTQTPLGLDTSPDIERRQIESWLLVAHELDALRIPITIGGSIASSFAGEPRSTIDIDIVVALEERHVDPLVASLSAESYIDAESLRRASGGPA